MGKITGDSRGATPRPIRFDMMSNEKINRVSTETKAT
jgi:hypothetical protein